MANIKYIILKLIPDKLYLMIKFYIKFKKKLDLKNPQTFNEKLQWIKLYDRNPNYVRMADKYEARKYIAEKINDKYLIPLLGVYNRFEEINFNILPNKFVIKCNHDSGGVIICKDKEQFNKESAKKQINKCLKRNYFYFGREWPYKNIAPKIIIEKHLGDNLIDYRFYCFNNNPEYIYMYINHSNEDGSKPEPTYCNIYNMKWEKQKFRNKFLSCKTKYFKPYNFELMKKISKILSEDTKFLRVDFYEIKNKLYIGELTFFPGGGFSKFYSEKYDKYLGDKLNILEEASNEK